MFGFSKRSRRKKLLEEPLPESWLRIIEKNVAVFSLVSAAERERLIAATKIIVAERSFVGSGGLAITDEVKLTIAAQAAVLLLGEAGYYFDRVPTIFVHPHHQTTKSHRDLTTAVLVEEDVLIEGQALAQGEIRLVWRDVLFGSRDPADGENVVFHEFAHHLDRLDGEVGGIPPLPSDQQRDEWVRVFDRELADLRREISRGNDLFLHEEAAENRAELFAYSTECFFEQPRELAEYHPDLFDCLLSFYKTDPRNWFGRSN
ncbi:MAG: zinc-dependent peptidase [Planctomycetia bacterium]|jgi:Mlc titration factor MtfA (ptsG expression regulator)|nr:zinc-dependent peptidase [Planctomycetia bacterium]